MRRPSIPGPAARIFALSWLLFAALSPSHATTTAADLAPAIAAALSERGAPADVRIILADPALEAPVGPSGQPEFDAVSYNPRSGRFLMRMRPFGGGADILVAGVARAPATAPALIGPVARGEMVSPDNVALVETLDLEPGETALARADVEGTLARRSLAAGSLLRARDLELPKLVRKGALVTISYERPGLRLAQRGVALSAGARGDMIEVEIAGGRTLRAMVTAAGAAAVIGSSIAGMEVR